MVFKRLNNRTILLTRPRHQAQQLVDLIEDAGGKAIVFPTLQIIPPDDSSALQKELHRLPDVDIVIFVSANAVDHAMPYWKRTDSPTIVAIGPGTAQALHRHGIPPTLVPKNYSSEGIVNLSVFQAVAHKKILICCGEHSRPYLKDELQKRGAIVSVAICYRRACPSIDAHQQTWIQQQPIDFIVSTSKESLHNLHALFYSSGLPWLTNIPLLVISDAMAAEATALGFRNRIIVARNASNEAILGALLHEA